MIWVLFGGINLQDKSLNSINFYKQFIFKIKDKRQLMSSVFLQKSSDQTLGSFVCKDCKHDKTETDLF